MNKYYYEINFNVYSIFTPWHTTNESKRFEETAIEKDIINSKFIKWLDSLDLYILNDSRMFHAGPGARYDLHKDIGREQENDPDYHDCVKLNIIYDAIDSKMIWFELKDKDSVITDNYNYLGEGCNSYIEEGCDIVFETSVLGPIALINGSEIHTLDNPSGHRWCYSFVLYDKSTNKRLKWQDIPKKFGELI
jgi:hypothetical protein